MITSETGLAWLIGGFAIMFSVIAYTQYNVDNGAFDPAENELITCSGVNSMSVDWRTQEQIEKDRNKIPLEGGWKENTYYEVAVRVSEGKLIHKAIFFSGFIDINGDPAGYNVLFKPHYAKRMTIKDVYFLKAIKEIDFNPEVEKYYTSPCGAHSLNPAFMESCGYLFCERCNCKAYDEAGRE